MALKSSTAIAIRQFQSETDLICSTPQPRSVSLAVWLLVGLLVSVVVVTLTVSVDKIVSSTAGKIVSVQQLTVLQALDPSIIKSLDVKEGESVLKGQQLATLDSTFTTADLGQLKAQVAGLTAQIARADAELQKTPFDPVAAPGDPIGSYMQLQKTLYQKRAAQYAADTLSFDEKIKQQQANIAKLETDVASYKAREKISSQVEGMRDTLFKSGSSSLLNLLTATERAARKCSVRWSSTTTASTEARHQIAALEADRDSYVQKWLSDTTQEEVTARNNLDTAPGLAGQGGPAPGSRARRRGRAGRGADAGRGCRSARCSSRAIR